MKLFDTTLSDLKYAESNIFKDDRGSFQRMFCAKELESCVAEKIVQINISKTAHKGTVRGLHYQVAPSAEMKCIKCTKGRIWDVAVDLRMDSPTFKMWYAIDLNENDTRLFIIPKGFAHGFQSLEDDCELIYLHTEYYTPNMEGGIAHNDDNLGISWPLPIETLSDRDRSLPNMSEDFQGLKV